MQYAIRLTAAVAIMLAASLATAVGAQAQVVQSTTSGQAAIGAKALAGYKSVFLAKTGMTADAVLPSPVLGFVEVDVGTTVYYMDTAGKWLLDGHVVDLATRTSITAGRKLALEQASHPAMDWKSLNLADAIKTVRGTATAGRVLVTFEDPNCSYCKKLTPEMERLSDITIFNFPVAVLGPDSEAKNKAIWCSKDRNAAWSQAMKGAAVPNTEGASCDISALARNAELARKLRVNGTPTLFFADGSRAPGYLDALAIETRIGAVKAPKVGSAAAAPN